MYTEEMLRQTTHLNINLCDAAEQLYWILYEFTDVPNNLAGQTDGPNLRRQHPELLIWLPAVRGRPCPPGRPFPLRALTPGTTTRRGSRPRGWCAPTEQMHAGSLEGSATIRKARGYSLYNVLVSSGSSQWNLFAYIFMKAWHHISFSVVKNDGIQQQR